MTIEQIKFIDMITPLAKQVCEERHHSVISAITCVCQAICESNYGKSTIMSCANALFGIKATKSWIQTKKYGGLIFNAKTKECYDGNNYVTISDSFRAYHSVIDSVRDYFDLIELPRYAKSLECCTVKDCITEIKNGGYATSPIYISTIVSICNSVSDYILPYFTNDKESIIANEVIAGKWGNGPDRKIRLAQAGYDAGIIQKKVNEILLGRR